MTAVVVMVTVFQFFFEIHNLCFFFFHIRESWRSEFVVLLEFFFPFSKKDFKCKLAEKEKDAR